MKEITFELDEELDKKMKLVLKKLDNVTLRAIMAVMEAMQAGVDNQTAVEIGNRILITAGYAPFDMGGFTE